MSHEDEFLRRLVEARRAAWLVFLIAVGLQIFVYLAYLGMTQGWLDGLIDSGVYGDVSRDELARVTFFFIAALKLMNIAIFMGSLFLTLWIRGLRR